MTNVVLSLGKADHLARIVSVKELPWPEVARRFSVTPKDAEDKASAGWYCPATFEPKYRDSKNFKFRHALTFDYDVIDQWDVTEIIETYKDLAYVMYTTASHTPEKPRIRMVLPLSRPANVEEFCCVTRTAGARFDLEKLARESDTPAQMMFLPTKKSGAEFWSKINEGLMIDVDATLGVYNDWTDRSKWPKRLRADSVGADKPVPPDSKAGIVGDFCRAFRVPDSIQRFALPYVPGSNSERYTYSSGSRPDGLRIYDDGLKAHSDHNTDPAHGQNNAFDLVRLHRFGALDTEADLAKSVTERPSYREMIKLCAELPELQTVVLANEFVDLGPAPVEAATTPAPNEAGASPIILARPLVDVLSTPTIPRWLLRDKLERSVIALMAGTRGSYKSFIALDWAMNIALKGNPVYVASAEGADFDRRARAWLRIYADDMAPSALPLYVLERRIDLNQHENIELIRQDCVRLDVRPVLFVLDTFSKLSGGLDENSNTEVKAFIGRLDNGIKRPFDATVLLIAHTGHSDRGRARGASALEADTDAAYIVTRNDTTKSVAVSRQRFKSSPELEPLWLEPASVPLGYNDLEGEPVTSLVMKPGTAPVGKGNGKVNLTPKQLAVLKIAQHELSGTSSGQMGSDSLAQAVAYQMVQEPGKRDTRNARAVRVLESLVEKKYLFMKGNKLGLSTAEPTEDF